MLVSDALSFLHVDATKQQLHEQRQWHKLLHYEKALFAHPGVKSSIHTSGFFLAPMGNHDPKAEMLATLSAFLKPAGTKPDEHAQCKFRARYLWLKDRLNFNDRDIPAIQCPEFEAWSLNGKTESISVIFATGFLGNPASYYGHTLIKMNAKDESQEINLLDVTVNFGAIVPDGDDPVTYIAKSLTGGYEAGFSHINYYFHTHNYGEIEQRNLWEYELSLDQKDTQLVIAHIWEVLGKKYTYYFFNKNCVTRMGELLEIIDGIDVIPDNHVWVIPQTMIQKLGEAQYKGRSLVKRVEYHPSRQSRFYHKYASLETDQKVVVQKVANDTSILESNIFADKAIASRYVILDTLLDYFQYIREPDALSNDHANIAYQKVLAKRYELPPGEEKKVLTQPDSPHISRDASFIQFGMLENKELGAGKVLTIRPAYYDELDGDHGHVQHAELTMGRLQLVEFENDIDVRSLQIVSIKSRNATVTGLPGDTGSSWQLNIGFETQDLECDHSCLVARLQADKGYTWPLTKYVFAGGYLGAAIQDNRNDNGNFFLNASAFTIVTLHQNLTLKTEYHYRAHLDSSLGDENAFSLTGRYQFHRNWDIRAEYQHSRADEFSLTLGHYW